MKNNLSIYLIILLFTTSMMQSCSKDDSEDFASGGNSTKESLELQITDSTFIDPGAYSKYLYKEVIDGYDFLKCVTIENTLFQETMALLERQLSPAKARLDSLFTVETGSDDIRRCWQIESWSFSYPSKSARGQDVMLSGRVTFPNNIVDGLPHQVSSLTLNMHHALPVMSVMPSQTVDIWTMRSLLNSAVIEPDGQGCGVNMDKDYYCTLSPDVLACQMADCAMAALEIMKKRGVTLASDGQSIITSCSLGAAVPLAFTKYYETEASVSFRDAIKLSAAFTGFGPLDFASTLRYYGEHPDFNAMLAKDFICSLSAYSPEQLGGFKAEDFIDDIFLNTMVTRGDDTITYYEAEARYFINVMGTEWLPNPRKLSCILADDMTSDERTLDETNLKTRVLMDIIKKGNDYSGWRPNIPIYIAHCRQDDASPYGQSRQLYERISRQGTNPNVKFITINTPAGISHLSGITGIPVIHAVSILKYFIPAYLHEDPALYFK